MHGGLEVGSASIVLRLNAHCHWTTGYVSRADFDWILAGKEQDTEERESSSDGDGIDLSSAMANARANLAAGADFLSVFVFTKQQQ